MSRDFYDQQLSAECFGTQTPDIYERPRSCALTINVIEISLEELSRRLPSDPPMPSAGRFLVVNGRAVK